MSAQLLQYECNDINMTTYGYFQTFWSINSYGKVCIKVTRFKGSIWYYYRGSLFYKQKIYQALGQTVY